jgi:hypothetical protein
MLPMDQTKLEPAWTMSPWVGDSAGAQWELWRAGIEWSALSNWFAPQAASPFQVTLTPSTNTTQPKFPE